MPNKSEEMPNKSENGVAVDAAAAGGGAAAAPVSARDAGSAGLAEAVQLDVPVAGLGVDIVEVSRIQAILGRSQAFATRAFSEEEQEYCNAKRSPAVHYATHFAAKEAVLKALGTGFSGGIGPRDVEVAHDEKGRPVAVLHGRAQKVAAEKGIEEIHISLSRTHDTAVANAIATTAATKPIPPEERLTPKQQIASAFKELRGMLDGLDALGAEPEGEAEAAGEVELQAEPQVAGAGELELQGEPELAAGPQVESAPEAEPQLEAEPQPTPEAAPVSEAE